MNQASETNSDPGPSIRGGSAFLLSQIGGLAARRYAERIAELDLIPAQTGLMWAISRTPGQSQQALAAHIGAPASRLVDLIDDLEKRDLVERRRGEDRRTYELHLTDAGRATLERVFTISREHEQDLLSGLDDGDRATLYGLLARIADDRGLEPGVHPGYRRLRRRRRDDSTR